jgi:hypothetical protein
MDSVVWYRRGTSALDVHVDSRAVDAVTHGFTCSAVGVRGGPTTPGQSGSDWAAFLHTAERVQPGADGF